MRRVCLFWCQSNLESKWEPPAHMWTPKPNGSATVLNSPTSPTAQCSPEAKLSGSWEVQNVATYCKNFARFLFSWCLLLPNANNLKGCKRFNSSGTTLSTCGLCEYFSKWLFTIKKPYNATYCITILCTFCSLNARNNCFIGSSIAWDRGRGKKGTLWSCFFTVAPCEVIQTKNIVIQDRN